MILVGNQRGGAKDLALHLLKEENEHVEIHEVRGFVSHNLMGALNEAYAISHATRCKQFLFSLSLNPPQNENVSVETFAKAIEKTEKKLGLSGQPRAIVFHEKNGRRHCHVVWSRIKVDEMKAVQLSFTKRRLMELSRELFIQHGWAMPAGLIQSQARDPRNYTHAQWQQAKRIGKDPRRIKAVFQECWALSDTKGAFATALKEHGYVLARGDRRGFVAVNHRGEVFSISKKWVGINAKEVRAKLTDEKSLPSVDEARAQIANEMAARLNTLFKEQSTVFNTRMAELEEKRQTLTRQHNTERQKLRDTQHLHWQSKQQEWQRQFNKGIRGLFDRITGKRKNIEKNVAQDTWHVKTRQQQERDKLIFNQLATRRILQSRIKRLESLKSHRLDGLGSDISQYQNMREQRLDPFDRNHSRSQQRGPELGR